MKRFAGLALAACAAAVLTAGARPAAADDPVVKFERYTLPNGLEVILHQDNSVPLVAVDIWYHVGSGDETPGKSGFAHVFEHMLFQGSEHVGEDRHFDILKKIGATAVNGTTNTDRTNYFEVVPSNQLETALWLESDRMGYLLPLLTEKSLDNQREVVLNERRQNYENVPYGLALFEVSKLLYPEGHPYRYLTIGRHDDVANASLTDVRNFYKKWYVPANATLCIAGDIDPAQAKKLIQKWFGDFPVTQKPAHHPPPTPAITHVRSVVHDPLAKLERIEYVWNTPAFFAPGDADLDILADALARTGTGRLYKILVHDKQLAQSVNAYQASRQFSSYFTVVVTAKTGADMKEIERIINQELDKVMKEPITQREFDRAVTNRVASYTWGLETLLARAQQLQAYNHYVGNPDYITKDLDRYRHSSPAKVLGVAARYLATEHRAEVLTMPAAAKTAAVNGVSEGGK